MSNILSGIAGVVGQAAAAPVAPEIVTPKREPKLADKHGWWWGTGRRKTAVARVRLKPAEAEKATFTFECKSGKVKTITEYFTEERDQTDCELPQKLTGTLGRFQVVCSCHGGGFMGQAQAVRLAVARALCDYDPSFELVLRQNGLLTRDAREVERKKYGQAGARRRFQFSKR
jgi:small subunit ribosomal protein S9